MKIEKKELNELRHEPQPGYRKVFFAVLSIGVLYLSVIFLLSLL